MRSARTSQPPEKVELNMTPMIDIVFQLLIFFLLTLRIVPEEGDFQIKMPLGRAEADVSEQLPPLKVRLIAAADGELTRIEYNGQPLASVPDRRTGEPDGGFADLRNRVLAYVGAGSGPGGVGANAEVELDCDYGLRYEYVVRAISAVSGERRGERIVPLVEKIKFAPPRPRR